MASVSVVPAGNLGEPRRSKHHACPHCQSDQIYRQRARGIIERHVVRAFRFYPFWCAGCDRRFYLRAEKSRWAERVS